jgi:hypothetical protein
MVPSIAAAGLSGVQREIRVSQQFFLGGRPDRRRDADR